MSDPIDPWEEDPRCEADPTFTDAGSARGQT